jgi:Domain of unknown function (DUF1707)/2TM domain
MCHARRYHEVARPAEEPLRHDPAVRASDAEREATVALLREHGAAGRLGVDELEQRVGAAYEARTRGDLAALVADLPSAPARRTRPAGRNRHHGDWSLYLSVSVLLVVIWALTGAGYFWPVWPIAGWGLALTMETAPRLLRPR